MRIEITLPLATDEDFKVVIAAIRERPSSYVYMVQAVEDLPSCVCPEDAPVACWVSSMAQYFYSLDGKQWLAQSQVFPEDFPAKVPDGNI